VKYFLSGIFLILNNEYVITFFSLKYIKAGMPLGTFLLTEKNLNHRTSAIRKIEFVIVICLILFSG